MAACWEDECQLDWIGSKMLTIRCHGKPQNWTEPPDIIIALKAEAPIECRETLTYEASTAY